MPESSSSEASGSEKENEDILSAISPVTPLTAISSSDILSIDTPKERRRNRRDSSVRFSDASPLPAEELRSSSFPTPKDGCTIHFGRDDRGKSPLQSESYGELLEDRTRLEDRVSMLEARFRNLDPQRLSDFSDKGDGSSERSGLGLEPQWQTWQEYLEPATTRTATNIMEVLIEKPHTNKKSSLAISQPETAFESASPVKNIERIRFRSIHIINALQQVTEQTFPNSSCFTIHRPFKILLFYEKGIENHLSELEEIFSGNAHCVLGEKCRARVDLEDLMFRSSDSYYAPQSLERRDSQNGTRMPTVDDRADCNLTTRERPLEERIYASNAILGQQASHSMGSDDPVCKHEVSDDLLAQGEAITHLRALLKFMKEDMRDIFRRHRLLRSSKAEMISFTDVWHLFMAGDLVVTNDESKQMIYRVSILPAGSPFSSRRPVKEVKMRSEGSHQHLESIYGQESMSVSHIDVFYYNFDGRNFGPVEERLTIVSYDGMKKITDLPVYPLRFRADFHIFKAKMLERGRKFRDLLTKPHWEYNGLSAAEPQEQIDSQVIIDIPLAYRKHPERAPKFGLKSWVEDSARIVTEACGVPGCTECFKERFMFDDHRIDRQRTVEFVKANESLLRTIKDIEELTDDLMLLLPNRVYGFVLRSRRWYYLDIDRVHQVHRQSEGFESLILPQGVARLVEGLVQTHGARDETAVPVDELDSEHQFDLVRGKGKGLIILLHGAPGKCSSQAVLGLPASWYSVEVTGAPGVGKTSTAECVADYTRKPLFPITCGDIGETAKEVEQNLEQNFSLAHRWDCVLLLDEADVFLQARDKEDMRRNSVVSVFLRVLEYYSGILFLTTNKVGHFDEAFKSRIHVSLYYPQLDEDSTIQIWKMNLRRLLENKKHLDVDSKAIKKYASKHYANLEKAKRGPWNGRQIKNAFQTAIALAEFDAKTNNQTKPVLTVEHFQVVAKASEGFDEYLSRIHGTDMDRARREGQRDDERSRPVLFPIPQRSFQKQESTPSSSTEDSEEEKKSKKAKLARRKGKNKKSKPKAKAQGSSSNDSFESSSSEDSSEARQKKKNKKGKPKGKAQSSSSNDSSESSSSENSEARQKRKSKDKKLASKKEKEGRSSRSKSKPKGKGSESDRTSTE